MRSIPARLVSVNPLGSAPASAVSSSPSVSSVPFCAIIKIPAYQASRNKWCPDGRLLFPLHSLWVLPLPSVMQFSPYAIILHNARIYRTALVKRIWLSPYSPSPQRRTARPIRIPLSYTHPRKFASFFQIFSDHYPKKPQKGNHPARRWLPALLRLRPASLEQLQNHGILVHLLLQHQIPILAEQVLFLLLRNGFRHIQVLDAASGAQLL